MSKNLKPMLDTMTLEDLMALAERLRNRGSELLVVEEPTDGQADDLTVFRVDGVKLAELRQAYANCLREIESRRDPKNGPAQLTFPFERYEPLEVTAEPLHGLPTVKLQPKTDKDKTL